MKMHFTLKASSLLLLGYLCIAAVTFFCFALPYLEGQNETRWAADSLDYIAYFDYDGLDQQLIQLGQNLFGPLVLLWVTGGDNTGIFFINLFLFVAAWIVVLNNLPVNRRLYFAALALNPLMFFSLLAVNKEIISVLVIALYAAYLRKGIIGYLLLALLAAVFVRWQNVLVILLFEILRIGTRQFGLNRRFVLIFCILAISLVYPFFNNSLGAVTTEIVDERQAETSFGLVQAANSLQGSFGGYLLVVIPKVLANWFGNLPRAIGAFTTPWAYDLSDPYSTFGITGHQLAMLAMVLVLMYKRLLSLNNDLIFFALFYSVIYSLSSFIQYRYFFPVYIVFSLVLAEGRNAKHLEGPQHSYASFLPNVGR